MFSYLRTHRRTPSNPTSPVPEQAPSWEASLRSASDHAHPQRYPTGRPPEQSTNASQVFSLPPITRVSSADGESLLEIDGGGPWTATRRWEQETPHLETTRDNARSRETNTYANFSRKPSAGNQRPGSAGDAAPSQQSGSHYVRPQRTINHDFGHGQRPAVPNPSFIKEPTGVRLPTPPPTANATSTFESSRPGKRLNLLNPMSLLARRRTNNVLTQGPTEPTSSSRTGSHFNGSHDFRIRGTVVHDFSAPRPRRVEPPTASLFDGSYATRPKHPQQGQQVQSGHQTTTAEDRLWTGGNYSPAFTEDFEDEQYPAAGPHVRKTNDLSDLPLPKPPYAEEGQIPASKTNGHSNGEKSLRPQTSTDMPRQQGRSSPNGDRRISIDPASTPPKSTASKGRRSRKASDVSVKNTGSYPRHMKSTSSRFSFDMIGAAEQERVLEDRHRQRALQKENEVVDNGEFDDFDEDFNYDNMDEDDYLEERIPGVNADYNEDEDEDEDEDDDDDDEPHYNYLQPQVPSMDIASTRTMAFEQQVTTPLSPYSPITRQDAIEDVEGVASTNNHSSSSLGNSWRASTTFGPLATGSVARDAEPDGIKTSSPPREGSPPAESNDFQSDSKPYGMEDDDFYYDDGIIEELGEDHEAGEFDESVFDKVDTDEHGRPLKPVTLPTLYSPPILSPDIVPPGQNIKSCNELQSSNRKDTVSTETGPPEIGLGPRPSVAGMGRDYVAAQSNHLTQDSLEAYQSALAAAAFDAAANGKFRRDSTLTIPMPSEQEDPQPGFISDSSHTSHYEPFSPNYDFEDDFDYDDALEDDPIIAAANAEALANDMDGFYGQEFGFFSAPSGEAEYANGGYFGPRGVDAVGRSQSGRVVSREPNLTPITERSEYSNRNSLMSLPMHRPDSVINPGLAQLANMPEYEGDMSLDALLKLRRGAWGGSQASLRSSNGSPRSAGADESSPVSQISPLPLGGVSALTMGGHKRQNSGFSGFSIASEGAQSPAPTSPTVAPVPLSLGGPSKSDKEKNVESRDHRYTLSAESISYSKEDDPQSPTGERWVLERRRTSEHGVELLGREVVSGGTI